MLYYCIVSSGYGVVFNILMSRILAIFLNKTCKLDTSTLIPYRILLRACSYIAVLVRAAFSRLFN